MRLYEFSHNVEFKIQQFGFGGARIHVLSDMEIDRDDMPELYQKAFKYPNQIGMLDLGNDVKGYPNVENVFLASEARGQGLGKLVYTKALEFAKAELGAKGISSDPESRNINSDEFWSKHRQGSQGGFDTRKDEFK